MVLKRLLEKRKIVMEVEIKMGREREREVKDCSR